VPRHFSDADLDFIYQQLRRELFGDRGEFKVTTATSFRPLTSFITELPHPGPTR
jgi:hypothetical protein